MRAANLDARVSRQGDFPAPRLILGDNGFLRRYGSRLSIAEIAERIRFALELAQIGVGAGDERVLRAAYLAGAPWTLMHTDVSFRADGRRAHFGRCMATLGDFLERRAPGFVQRDDLMGGFIRRFARYRAYTPHAVFEEDGQSLSRTVDLIARFRPPMTSIGGDYLDALLALGDIDVAQTMLDPVIDACRDAASVPVLTTYLAGLIPHAGLVQVARRTDGVMVPHNAAGLGMPPDRETVRTSLSALGKPLIAMHVLGSGRLPVPEALDRISTESQVVSVVVGATSEAHIQSLVAAAQAKLFH